MGSASHSGILVLRRVALASAAAAAVVVAVGCGAARSSGEVAEDERERADAPPRHALEAPVLEAPPPEPTRPPLALARVPEAGAGALDEVGLVIEVSEAAIVVDNEPAVRRLLGDRSQEAPLPCEGAVRPREVATALRRRSPPSAEDPFAGIEGPRGAGQPIRGGGVAK